MACPARAAKAATAKRKDGKDGIVMILSKIYCVE
jgi:hypothetical protein